MVHQSAARKTRLSALTSLIPGLPKDVGIICLAKVSLSYYGEVGLVCKDWHDVLREEYFWDVRHKFSNSEELLLLWARAPSEENVWRGLNCSTNTWFKLPTMPDDDMLKGSSAFAAVDGKLFVIGGCTRGTDLETDSISEVIKRQRLSDDERIDDLIKTDCLDVSSTVRYFDMKRYEWRTCAPLNIARAFFTAGVINGQLYVCGGMTCENEETATAEVYNPITQTWKLISSMPTTMAVHQGAVMDGKFYVVSYLDKTGAVYDPQSDEWVEMSDGLESGFVGKPVEFMGKICTKRDSRNDGGRHSTILAYNNTKDTWETVDVGSSLSGNAPRSFWGREPGVERGENLVVLGKNLCIIHSNTGPFRIEYKITDLSNKELASEYFDFDFEAHSWGAQFGSSSCTQFMIEHEVVTL